MGSTPSKSSSTVAPAPAAAAAAGATPVHARARRYGTPATASATSANSSCSGRLRQTEFCVYLDQTDNGEDEFALSTFKSGVDYLTKLQKNGLREIAMIVDARRGLIQGFNLKLVERLGYVSEELLGQPIKTLMSVEQEKSHGSWEVVVRTYFSQIFETGRQFPYHVAVLPHANQEYFIPCQLIVEHLEPQAKFEQKAERRRQRAAAATAANGGQGSLSKKREGGGGRGERATSPSPRNPSPRNSPHSDCEQPLTSPSTISLPAAALFTQTATNSGGSITITPTNASSHRESNSSTVPNSPVKQPVLGLPSQQLAHKVESMLHRIPYFIVIFTPQSTDNYGRSVGMQKISALQMWEQDRAGRTA